MVPQVFSVSLQYWNMMKPSKKEKRLFKSNHTRNNLTRMQVITVDIPITKDQQRLARAKRTNEPRFTTIVPVIVQEGTDH